MAKKVKEENKKVTEEVSENKKKKLKKAPKKSSSRKLERENIQKERKVIEDQIDSLVAKKKATKDKKVKKELTKEINTLKYQRKEVGKKDTYLRNVKKEMSMVRWPSSKEIFKYSLACLIFVAFFAIFFYGVDALFALVKDLID